MNGSENAWTPASACGYGARVPRKFVWPLTLIVGAVLAAATAMVLRNPPRSRPRVQPSPVTQVEPAPRRTDPARVKDEDERSRNGASDIDRAKEDAAQRARVQEEERAKVEAVDRLKKEWEVKVKNDVRWGLEGEPGKGSPKRGSDNKHTWSSEDRPGYFACHLATPPGYQHSEVRMMAGDDMAWAQPDWDDREWRDITDLGVPQRTGVFWIRYRVRTTDQATIEKRSGGKSTRVPAKFPAGVFNKVNAAFDMFWDGKLLARSGVPADRRSEESPGKVDTVFSVPDEWRGSGEHVVAMRMSTHFSDFPGEWTDFNAGFGEQQEMITQFHRAAFQPTLNSGAMFMVAAMGFVLWLLADRRPALLLFVGLCLCAALIQWLSVWRYFYTYTYDWHYPIRLAAVYLTTGFGACLLMFVAVFFAVPHRWWLLAGYVALAAAILWLPRNVYFQPMNQKAGLEATAAFAVTLACAAWAIWRRQRSARLVAAGLLLSVVLVRQRLGNFVEGSFLPATMPAMLGLLSAVALRVRDERRKAEQAQLTAARLEVELLKKNLQPHFLMNTLTALTEVIEQNPGAAAALINDLAMELRTLSRMSGDKRVTLGEEIELCRVHLRLMSVRTGVAWSLAADEVDENAVVPPAIFLTLIENAFVHQRVTGREAAFRLKMEMRDDATRYTFVSPGEVKPAETVRVSGGTGLRYVRARLEESFPGRWTFAHHAVPGGWETVISVRAEVPGAS